MIIIPSILEKNCSDLEKSLSFLSPFYHHFQIDIADGIFVPNTTVQIDDISHLTDLADSTVFDFHLMVQEPLKHVEMIKNMQGITLGNILIHKSVFPNYSLITSHYPLFRFGLVLNPKDEVDMIDTELMNMLPVIQIMTVIPGFQGSSFVKESLTKIEQLRKKGFQGKIYIDGAINETTLPLITSLPQKPDVLCPGSYLTKSPAEDLEKRVKYLKLVTHNL